jgi:hypothetical protein
MQGHELRRMKSERKGSMTAMSLAIAAEYTIAPE